MKIKDFFYSQMDTLEKDDIPVDWWLERFRNWRAVELINTDWTQLSDAPVDSQSFANYRSILRHLPQDEDFANAEIPVRP